MPFKSAKQRAYLAIHEPAVAHKFAADTYKVGKDGKGPLVKMTSKRKDK